MENNKNYLQRVLALSEKQHVETSSPVYTSHGIKLLDSGVKLSPSLYDKVVLHKLVVPIDECLTLENPVTLQGLKADLERLVLSQHLFKWLTPDESSRNLVFRHLSTFTLSPLAIFKLTILRQVMPDAYQHSLEVAYCALVLAINMSASDAQWQQYALAAGLFHDIGLLHIHPSVLEQSGRLDELERHQIYAHPVTGSLIVCRLKEWPAAIGQAILEHHERLDGSGYPRALSGENISPLGQLLGLAELAATVFSRKEVGNLSKNIQVVLRLNQGKFSKELAGVLVEMAIRVPEDACRNSGQAEYAEILSSLVELSTHIQEWNSIKSLSVEDPLTLLISHRVELLEHNLAGLGVDLQYWGMVDGELDKDGAALQELSVCIREGRWILTAITLEVNRRWDSLRPRHLSIENRIRDWVEAINAEVS